MPDKTCPKCSKEMTPIEYLGIIPAIKQTLAGDVMSERRGRPYRCGVAVAADKYKEVTIYQKASFGSQDGHATNHLSHLWVVNPREHI